MSISSGLKPLNAFSLRTPANFSTVLESPRLNLVIVVALFLLVCTSTLTIWTTGPLASRIYECCVLSIAGILVLSQSRPISWRLGIALCALPAWGFAQLAFGATVYPYATFQSTLQLAALSATAYIAYCVTFRDQLLTAVTWFGFLVAIASVLAYYTSPHQILWLIDAPYPDTWGPFLSRNNFAQFLEFTLPMALWLASTRRATLLYWAMAATMLAAGLISASRAGAFLLCLEALLLVPYRNRKLASAFILCVALLAIAGGAETLLRRFSTDLRSERTDIYRSTLAMIDQRPLQGYGLGTFALVYPEFATFDSGYVVDHAHNDWLEWTSEGGLGFAAAWLILFSPAIAKVRSHFWALGIPAVFLHALVDFPFARIGIAAWAFFLMGLLESSPQPVRRTT